MRKTMSLRMRQITAIFAVAAFVSSTVVATPAFATGELPPLPAAEIRGASGPEQAANRFVVKFRDKAGISSADRDDVYGTATAGLEASATELFQTGTGASVVVVDKDLTPAESAAVVTALAAAPNVEYVEPDVLLTASSMDPNDPLYSRQWDLWEPAGGANVPAAWATTRGEGQTVAVVDTGITNHHDLNAQILPGYDLISDASMARDGDGRDNNPQDEGDWSTSGICSYSTSSWHGTHVAGIVAASSNNGIGISGVAPAAKIVPVRVLGECGGYMTDIADGIIWAAGGQLPNIPVNKNPARVINLSIGGVSKCSAFMQDAVDYAASQRAVVVVAAGNGNQPVADSQPANCQNVIAVGSTGRNGSRAPYSNYGSGVDIMAPGGNLASDPSGGILSTLNTGARKPEAETYSVNQGTSMAAPHVAGAAALLLAVHPELTPAQVEARLKATARELPQGCSPYCGPKLLDSAAALTMALTSAPIPVIKGAATVGSTLTAVPGTWAPAPVELTYTWYRGTTAITGATATRYTPTSDDAGQTLSVEVTGAKPGYATTVQRSTATAKVTVAKPPFADVPQGMLFYDEMAWMAAQGISTGWAEANGTKTYRPLQAVNRNAMAAFMYRLAGSPEFTPPNKTPFTDVATSNQFYKEITWLASAGISTGWAEANGTKTYRPLQPVNRDAMAAFMYRFATSPGYEARGRTPFADVATTSQFYKEISWLASTGISTGWSDGTYRPVNPVNRDAMAAFMNRFATQFRR